MLESSSAARGADEVWGGKPGSAAKARAGMEAAYGQRHGMRVYAAKTVQREQSQSGIMGALRSVRRSTK